MNEYPCPFCGEDLPPGDRTALEKHTKDCLDAPKDGTVYQPKEHPQESRNDNEETPS